MPDSEPYRSHRSRFADPRYPEVYTSAVLAGRSRNSDEDTAADYMTVSDKPIEKPKRKKRIMLPATATDEEIEAVMWRFAHCGQNLGASCASVIGEQGTQRYYHLYHKCQTYAENHQPLVEEEAYDDSEGWTR